MSIDSFDPCRDPHRGGRPARAGVQRERLQPRRGARVGRHRHTRRRHPRLRRGPRDARPEHRRPRAMGRAVLIDPVIEPIGFGFCASLERYAEVHRRYPAAELLMGIGNITELTAADTTGVNAVLLAICQEFGRARGAHDRGDPVGPRRGARDRRRPAAHALRGHPAAIPQAHRRSPGHGQGPADPGLFAKPSCARCRRPSPTPTSASSPTARRSRCSTASGSFAAPTFRRSSPSSASTRPRTPSTWARSSRRPSSRITLGKTYRQEGSLDWGYLTPPDDPRAEHLRVTAHRARRAARPDAASPDGTA